MSLLKQLLGLFRQRRTQAGRAWDDPLDIAVITTQEVIDGKQPVTYVTRDDGIAGLGGWQFLDSEPLDGRQPVGIAKADLLLLDPSIAELIDLPVGWYAERDERGAPWRRGSLP